MLAVRPGGEGKRTRAGRRLAVRPGHARQSHAGRSAAESLFMVTNDGIARCLDTVTGRLEWKERLKGEYRASPLAADGRIYFLNTQGPDHRGSRLVAVRAG